MTSERFREIEKEGQRRLNLWLANTTFEKMTCGGSYKLFSMQIGLFGRGLQKEKWMSDDDDKKVITYHEWDSLEYDIIMSKLYESCTQ